MRYFLLTLLTIVTILTLYINIRLHTQNLSYSEEKEDIVCQLNYLESELKTNNLGHRMQMIFPEGHVFVNALYGLTWCELAACDSSESKDLKERAIKEALYAYNEIDSPKARRPFDDDIDLRNGVFYVGWKNYLLSRILLTDTTFDCHETYIKSFEIQCDAINEALNKSETPYLQSYYHQTWPADMFVTMASLSNHDKIFKSRYEPTIETWLSKVKDRLDKETMMVPHKVSSDTGETFQGARGSSTSLILRMAMEIDPDFGKEQFGLFDKKFVSKIFGLPSVREYPMGTRGSGDVDSGPVILGVGFSATIVSIGTFAIYGKESLYESEYKTINAFGFARKHENKKSYLFGKLPMADAFIAWSLASALKNRSRLNDANAVNCSWWAFHMISFSIVLLLWGIAYRKSLTKALKLIFYNRRHVTL
jgi:hypothetical protein